MIRITNISNRDRELLNGRRGFLKGMLGAGAFVLSVRLMPEELFGAAANTTAAEGMSKAQLQPQPGRGLPSTNTPGPGGLAQTSVRRVKASSR